MSAPNGEGKSREEFEREWKQLWAKCERLKTGEFLKPPALISQENHPVKRAARDFYGADVEEYVVNEAESYRELLEAAILTARVSRPQTAYRCNSAI